MSVYMLLFPVVVVFFLLNFKNKLLNPDLQSRFGSLYLDVKIESPFAYLQTVFFLLRRVFLAGSIVFGGDLPFIQVYINIGISFLLIIYML